MQKRTDDGASGDNLEDADVQSKMGSRANWWIGISLILLSGVFWFSLFAVPFLPVTVAQKTVIGAVLFVAVQVAWWIGAALVGPRAIKKLFGWFRRNKDDSA